MSPNNPILELFGRSPMKPLQRHMDEVNQCAQMLIPFFDAVVANNWADVAQVRENIVQSENAADALKHEIRTHLPTGLFMPVQREDVLRMVSLQDKIANKAKDLAGLVLGRKMTIPSSIEKKYLAFLGSNLATVSRARDAIQTLDNLLETGFRGQEVEAVQAILSDIDTLEHVSDECQIGLRQALHAIESEYAAIDIVFLYKTVELMADLADKAQHVGGQLEVLLAR